MALLAADLQAWIVGRAAITALIGDRVYPGKMPPTGGSYPLITYAKISSPRIRDMNGATGLVQARFQIGCWASRYGAAVELADTLRIELDNFRGTMGTTTIDAVQLQADSDIFNKQLLNDNIIAYGVRQDYQIRCRELVDNNTT